MAFNLSLNQLAKISISGEVGVVKGRAEFSESGNQYQLHYKAADGRACTDWFDEVTVEPAQEEKQSEG